MWVDVIIAVILAFTVIQGFRYGFVQTFIHTIGWLLAVVLGFVWFPYVIRFLKDNTDFYDSIHVKIVDKLTENASTTTESALGTVPKIIRDAMNGAIDTATDVIATSFADGISNIIFNIIGFLVVAIAIKLFLLFFTGLFSKKSNAGLIGWFDGFFGILAGGLKGIVLIYILLALLVPITSLTDSTFLIDELEASSIGSYLYDNNLILLTVKP